MPDNLFIIDVFSLMFQVFHAIPGMTSPTGMPTNACFGFTRDLLTLLKQKPTHLVAAMDSPGPGTRNDLYEQYKAHRTEMPVDLVPQVEMIENVMRGFRIPSIMHPGWEADDVLATLAKRATERGLETVIVTTDKDARQLIGPQVRLLNMRKNTYLDEAGLLADWGVRPDQVVDFQALVGDSVDNVPGVPLVGPKKASALLEQFGTLDEVLAHPDQARGKKLQENLREFAEQARVSRELVRLNTELPLDIDWDELRVSPPDVDTLLALFDEYGFRRFGDEVRQLSAQIEGGTPTAAPPRAVSVAAADTEKTATKGTKSATTAARPPAGLFDGQRDWEIVDDAEKFARFAEQLKQQKRFCLDLETTHLDALRADIVGWAFSWQSHMGYYVPVQGPAGQAVLSPEIVREALRDILEDPRIEICNQNIKYDMLALRRAGVQLRGVGVDPMVANYLLDAGARSHGLDALARKYLKHDMIPISDLIGTGRQVKCLNEVDVPRVAEYATEDADIAWQLSQVLSEELRHAGLWELYWDLERPLIPVLAEMEFTGIRVDVEELQRQSLVLGKRLDALMGEIHAEAGCEFNIDSPLQLRKVLFEDLGLPVQKKTKTGPSTDQSVLEKLALLHPLPAMITEHRHLSKLKGTYLDALPALVHPESGRIHASFNQVVAATGRLSSSNPNLQNIPIRTQEGRQVRRAFVPCDGDHRLLCADYSQIELRMLAHFSGDRAMQQAFADGADIHATVAAEIFGVDLNEVTSEMRRVAKAVNFGVVYGQSAFGLSAALGISQPEAQRFIEEYFEKYSGVAEFLEHVLDTCLSTGFARTILDRRRPISGIRSHRPGQRNMPERTAINTVIQGSAADLIKRAMLNVHERLERERHPAKMLLQIHDELVFEVPTGQVSSLASLVREEMEQAMELDVPIVVDVSVGENWLEVERL